MQTPTVSVVIPTHNRSKMVQRAVLSVLNQSYRDFEVIVVDDASVDDTAEALRRFSGIKVIRLQSNVGGAEARNRGIAASQGEFVSFLDSDDEYLPTRLEKQVPLLQEDRDLGAVYCRFLAEDGRLRTRVEQHPPLYSGMIHDTLLSGKCPHTTSLFLVRRAALDEVGGFDPALSGFQDTDLWLRMSKTWKFEAVDEALVVVHSHGGPRLTTDVQNREAAVEAFLEKWGNAMRGVIGEKGLDEFRRNKAAVARGQRVLSLVDAGHRREAVAALRDYLAIAGFSRPKQALGLLASVTMGPNTFVRLKRLMRSF